MNEQLKAIAEKMGVPKSAFPSQHPGGVLLGIIQMREIKEPLTQDERQILLTISAEEEESHPDRKAYGSEMAEIAKGIARKHFPLSPKEVLMREKTLQQLTNHMEPEPQT